MSHAEKVEELLSLLGSYFVVEFQSNSNICSGKMERGLFYYWLTPKCSSWLDSNHVLSLHKMIKKKKSSPSYSNNYEIVMTYFLKERGKYKYYPSEEKWDNYGDALKKVKTKFEFGLVVKNNNYKTTQKFLFILSLNILVFI